MSEFVLPVDELTEELDVITSVLDPIDDETMIDEEEAAVEAETMLEEETLVRAKDPDEIEPGTLKVAFEDV